MLGEAVGYVHRPRVTLMRGVEALRGGWVGKKAVREEGESTGCFHL